jgi:hypothetical protein
VTAPTLISTVLVDAALFLPFIVPEAPGVAHLEFIHALRRAVDEFCWRTWVWRVDLPDITMVAGTANYALTLPEGGKLGKVLEATYIDPAVTDPYDLQAVLADSAETLETLWQGSPPKGFTLPDARTVRLISTPANAGTVRVKAALRPTVDAANFPAILYQDYPEAMAAGTLAVLRGIPGKPYSDNQAAAASRERFLALMGQATIDAVQGHTRAVLESTPAW